MGPGGDTWQKRARTVLAHALTTRDERALSFTLAQLLAYTTADEATALVTDVLRSQDHDVQRYWQEECNCDGHQN